MSRRRRKKKKTKTKTKTKTSEELVFDPSVWHVDCQFTKGGLTKTRGVVVEVRHIPSGRKLKKSVIAGTKADARAKQAMLIQELISKLLIG